MDFNRFAAIVIIAMTTFSTLSHAQEKNSPAKSQRPSNTVEKKLLVDANKQSLDALTKKDLQALKRLIADDAAMVNVDGVRMDKQAFLADVEFGKRVYTSFDIDEPEVQIFETAAVVTGSGTANVIFGGRPVVGGFRYIKLLVKKDGTWKIAYWLSLPVALRAQGP